MNELAVEGEGDNGCQTAIVPFRNARNINGDRRGTKRGSACAKRVDLRIWTFVRSMEPPQHDRRRPLAPMLLDMHADDRSLDPGALDQRLHRLLAPTELVFAAVLREQPEAREIAEAVVDQ